MKTKQNFMKKLMLFTAAFAICFAVFAKPADVEAALTAPTNLKQTEVYTTSSQCYIKLQWDNTATSYCIDYSLDNRKTWTTYKDSWYSNSVIMNNLTPGITFYVRVTPIERNTKGTPSMISVTTAPRNVSRLTQTNASETSMTLSWPASAGATGYSVYTGTSVSFDNSTLYQNTTATSITIPTPKNAALYVFLVPYRGNCLSAEYARLTAVTAPTTPKDLSVYSINSDSKEVTFCYTPTSYTDNTTGYDFEVYRVTNKNGKVKRLKAIDTKNKYTYKVSVKSKYLINAGCKFRVRAYVIINGKKYPGAWSKEYYYTPGAKIKGKLQNQTTSSAKLSWSKVTGAASYTIWHKTSANGKWKKVKKNVKGTSATVKYSKSSTYNYYYVQANKARIGKKKVTSPSPNSNKAYFYSEFKKSYSYYYY